MEQDKTDTKIKCNVGLSLTAEMDEYLKGIQEKTAHSMATIVKECIIFKMQSEKKEAEPMAA